MLQNIPIPRYTVKDYNCWKGDWELIGGYPYALSPSPLPLHQRTGRKFIVVLSMQLEHSSHECDCEILYESDWNISQETVLRPDIMIVCGNIDLKKNIDTPPVLVVEILSEATRLKDRTIKFNLYQQYGVKYYLLADPDKQTLEAFELVNNQYAQMSLPAQLLLHKNCTVHLAEDQIFAP